MPDSLLQRSVGSTYWCSLTETQEGGTNRKGENIPDSKPKANLKSKSIPASQNSFLWLSRHCPFQLSLAGINGSTPPREE